jgi:hypothetical protein
MKHSKKQPPVEAFPENHRALSVRQPMAEEIMLGKKTIEYRSFLTRIRGMVYIYAALRHEKEDFENTGIDPDKVPYGRIVGTVENLGLHGQRFKL